MTHKIKEIKFEEQKQQNLQHKIFPLYDLAY